MGPLTRVAIAPYQDEHLAVNFEHRAVTLDSIRTRTLDVHVRRVRKKLGAYADQYIETIFGIGYRFQPFRIIRPRQESAQDPVAGVA
ncbi:MAG: winged helix-turn-helix domain-containing protein [Bryobacteraceae bacterium]